jgi:hypothetical protein
MNGKLKKLHDSKLKWKDEEKHTKKKLKERRRREDINLFQSEIKKNEERVD